ncbi:GIY-YIG nuclease family protein [Butyrivibrio sp.]|uniref:GIY-YIG nuclease family protein n=1 Tax=Butyrivibrio sp. TaxID=28121 RepID=UPI0025C1B8BE|nr:GIY-YIG nuclease family protein [Butyrivibrio sp.]
MFHKKGALVISENSEIDTKVRKRNDTGDRYREIEMRASVIAPLIVELFDGKRVKRETIIQTIGEEFRNRGGYVAKGYNVTACVKSALKLLESQGNAVKVVKGYRDISSIPNAGGSISLVKTTNTSSKIKGLSTECEIIGCGKEEVYLFYYPSYKELAELKGKMEFPCKIGRTAVGTPERVGSIATGMPEFAKIDLVIHTDDCENMENAIHSILKLMGRYIEESPANEWYLTNKEQVKEIYNHIDELQHLYRIGVSQKDINQL